MIAIDWSQASKDSLTTNARSSSPRKMADLIFQVEDTGQGIPEDKLSVIFEKFMQVDSSLARSSCLFSLISRCTFISISRSWKRAKILLHETRKKSIPFLLLYEAALPSVSRFGWRGPPEEWTSHWKMFENYFLRRRHIWHTANRHGQCVTVSLFGKFPTRLLVNRHPIGDYDYSRKERHVSMTSSQSSECYFFSVG